MIPTEFRERLGTSVHRSPLTPIEIDGALGWRIGGIERLLDADEPGLSDTDQHVLAVALGVSWQWLFFATLSPTALLAVGEITPILDRAAMTARQRQEILNVLERLP